MVGRLDRKPSADPLAITRAMLEGALHKANDAVHADRMQDWDYAMQSYGDSCALLGRCMERTNQTDEEGALHWQIMDGIVSIHKPLGPVCGKEAHYQVDLRKRQDGFQTTATGYHSWTLRAVTSLYTQDTSRDLC